VDTLSTRQGHSGVHTSGHPIGKLSRRRGHTVDPACPDVGDISRLTTPTSEKGGDIDGAVDGETKSESKAANGGGERMLPLMALVRRNGS
jgi:hypothetical protein